MAQNQVGPVNLRFKNSLKAVPDAGGDDTDLVTPVNYTSVNALKARLTAINAGYYTSTMLNQMTVNDMVYAVRMNDDKTTIASYL